MGTYEFRLPDIGEGVVEGEIVSWHVSVGDVVTEDQPLLEVMTDKASVEIPSPVDGKITSTTGEPGEIIPVGQVCIVFEVDGEGNSSAEENVPESTPAPEPAPAPEPVVEAPVVEEEAPKPAAKPSVKSSVKKATKNAPKAD